MWLLGSSDCSARLAAVMGLPFRFADFFGNTGEYGPQAADLYRKDFWPSEYLSEPKVNVGLRRLIKVGLDIVDRARHYAAKRA